MSDTQFEELRNPPMMLINFAKAVKRATVKPGSNPTLPSKGLRLTDVMAEPTHIAKYRKVCHFAPGPNMPITYPHMHAFPLHMALMLQDDFPFPAMGLVHVRNSITQYRAIGNREQMDIECSLRNLEKVDKGYEFAIFTQVYTGGELVWESDSVNFFRHGKGSGKKTKRDKPEPITDFAEWQVPGNIGRRYGAVSGDRNPIHLYPLTAKLFGFKRQIAHGMWSKARCLAELEPDFPAFPVKTDVQFKLPMFTPAKVKFHQETDSNGTTFGLFAKDGVKPHLAGDLYQVK